MCILFPQGSADFLAASSVFTAEEWAGMDEPEQQWPFPMEFCTSDEFTKIGKSTVSGHV